MKKLVIIFWFLAGIAYAGLDAASDKVINVATPTVGTDAANKQYVDDTSAAAGHNLLSVAHGDTTTDAVTRGSIIYGNSTPAWDELVLGASGTIFRSDGTDAGWAATTNITALGTIVTGTWQATDVDVPYGGTGVSTLTDGGILLGSGASAITALGVATNGQIPIGDGATDPVLATLTEGLAIDVTNGAGSITLAFDPTELLGSRTWGDASTDTIVWTWDRATGTDPTMTFGNDIVTFNGAITAGGAITDGAASSFTTGTTVGTLTLADGSITDSGGTIDFGNEILQTTGNLGVGAAAASSQIIHAQKDISAQTAVGVFGGIDNSLSTDSGQNVYGLNYTSTAKPNSMHPDISYSEIGGVLVLARLQGSTNTPNDLTATDLFGYKSRISLSESSNGDVLATNIKHFWATNPGFTGSSSAVNSYAFYDAGQTTAQNPWGFYSLTPQSALATDNAKWMFGATTTDLQISSDGTNGIIDVGTSLRLGNEATTYMEVETDADTFWVGAGTGLPFGSMYNDNTSTTVTIGTAGTFVRIPSGFTVGQLNLATFGNARELTVTKAGKYKIDWSISFNSDGGASLDMEGAIGIDNTKNAQGTAHRLIGAGNDIGNIAGTAILDLAANKVVSLMMTNNTSTVNIIVTHASLSLVQVGGT